MLEYCAAAGCDHDADVWTFSPRVDGLVPSCIAHGMDIVAGGTEIDSDAPVQERGVSEVVIA